ncbi:MAG: (2Fe-2S)-binding protein [Rhodospirillales bacterium]|mgnify:CR=1 FL=1|jgi:carbon-monoxide dehydrogenase small subunit|nr:(2Fe-2S)-binding protein [Rhodospirillales bacterium]MDP6773928.1 (2Fe-2S)-binding protein [Rhodospirillales bacterium]
MKTRTIAFTLNGEPREVVVRPNDLLLNVIRDHELLTGTKYGCGIGECGTCTVQVDGKPVLSCLTLAVAADGCQVVTIEGLAEGGRLDPVQEAFLDHAAVQCGFCTPGMIMTSRSLLDEIPQPTEEEVREYLRGCLCRCTGYASIVRAVLSVAEKGA